MKNRKKIPIWTLILIVAICYFSYTVYQQQSYMEARKKETAQLEKDIRTAEIKKEQLQQQKDLINTDEFAERIAREKLGYVKNGEKVYIDTNK